MRSALTAGIRMGSTLSSAGFSARVSVEQSVDHLGESEAVSPTKQRRIRGLAARFLREHPGIGAAGRGRLRFDVVSILDGTISVIEGAF